MSSEFARPVDAWSRFVAYCSLVVALGTLGWVWLGGEAVLESANGTSAQSTAGDLAVLNQLFEEEAAARKQRDDEMREAFRLEHQKQIVTYKDSADGMLAQHQMLITQLNNSVQPATFAALESLADSETEPETTTEPEPADATDAPASPAIGNDKIADMRPSEGAQVGDTSEDTQVDKDESEEFFSPLLSQVITAKKTDGTSDEQGVVVVRNTGSGKAMLARIQFTPSDDYNAIFEVDAPISLSPGSDDDVVEIVFSAQDNLADESGKHGIYKRQLSPTAFGVDSGDALRIRLAIANEKHIGWGFRGKLEISYNGPNPLVIEDAELVFVSGSQPIVQK